MNTSRVFSGGARWISTAAAVKHHRGKQGQLYQRLSALGISGGTAGQALNEYTREGRIAKKPELERCIKELRKYGRYHHALEVFLSL